MKLEMVTYNSRFERVVLGTRTYKTTRGVYNGLRSECDKRFGAGMWREVPTNSTTLQDPAGFYGVAHNGDTLSFEIQTAA